MYRNIFILSKIIYGRVEEDFFGLLKGRSKSTDFIFLIAESFLLSIVKYLLYFIDNDDLLL